jgi:hypothetical protein
VPKCAKSGFLGTFFLIYLCGLLSVFLLSGCFNSHAGLKDEKELARDRIDASANDAGTGGKSSLTDGDSGYIGQSGSGVPGGDGGTGGVVGTVDNGTEKRIQQDQISFIIYNDSSQSKYLYTPESGTIPVECDAQGVEESESCYLPYCILSCDEILEGDIECGGLLCERVWSAVRVLEPGHSTEILWRGKTYTIDEEICSPYLSCFWENDPFIGEYRISIEVYDEYTCDVDSCPIDINDDYYEIIEAKGKGEPTIYDAYFTVPHSDDSVTIVIDDFIFECDEEARGTVQCADYCGSDELIQPICVQEQWECAAGQVAVEECPPETCWGPPGICP